MGALEPAKNRTRRQLREAIEHLRSDIDRVEFWAEVLETLQQPVPGYDDSNTGLDRFHLETRADGETRRRDAACDGGPQRPTIAPKK